MYLLKSKLTYRVETVEQALQLREQLEAIPCGILKNFSYKEKERREKGEVIETYQIVTADLEFASEKEPDNYVSAHFEGDINYGD